MRMALDPGAAKRAADFLFRVAHFGGSMSQFEDGVDITDGSVSLKSDLARPESLQIQVINRNLRESCSVDVTAHDIEIIMKALQRGLEKLRGKMGQPHA